MIGDRRAPEAPPCDALAECVVLSRLFHNHEWIDRYDLEPMLVFPPHRLIWRSLKRAHQAQPDTDAHAFIDACFADLRQHHPDNWLDLTDVILARDEQDRAWEEYERAREDDPQGFDARLSSYSHTFDWWLARLQRIHDSRTLISIGHSMVDLGWIEDVETALGIASQITAIAKAPPDAETRLIDRLDV